MKTKNIKRKKYLTGGKVNTYVEDPTTEIAKNAIMLAQAQQEASSNPLVQGLNITAGLVGTLGNTLMSVGGSEEKPEKKRNGGRVSGVPVEVEGGEVAETPFGNLLGFNGPNHDRGGIKTSLTPGTEVYSKRIKIDGKTMADRKLSRERREKRFQKLSDRGDSIGRNTLGRVKTINLSQDEADKKVQDFYSLMDSVNAIQKFPDGGEVKPLTLAEAKKQIKFTPGKDTGYTAKELAGSFKPEKEKNIIDINNLGKHNDGTPVTIDEVIEGITGVSHDYKKTHNVEDYSPSTLEEANSFKNFKARKSLIDLNLIPGDLLGMAGNLYQAFAPLSNTMANRASDTPNINPYKGFGDDALKANDQAKTYAQRMLDSQLQDLESSSLSARRTSRNSAMGINTQRALDLAIESNKEKATRGIYDSFTNQMLGIFNAQSQLENQQDIYQMQGKAAQDLADRQDKDNFYSQLGIDKTNVGRGIAETGKALNQTRTNDATENLLNSMFRYTSVDGSTGKLIGKKGSKAAVAALASGDWINLNNPDTGKPFKTAREFAKYYNLKEKK